MPVSPGPLACAPLPAWMTPRTLLRVSIGVALLTIVLKTLAWWLTGSVGLLSDALEAFVNLAGAMFALAMVTVAGRPADAGHPYGHYKAEYFSSGFEGILIIGASMAILWVAVLRLGNPQPLEQLSWGLVLSMVSTALNGGLAWVMFRAAKVHRSMALEGDARHLLTDVWTSVGVVVGLGAAALTSWVWLDAAVAIAVALHILKQGVQLVWRSSQGLMDEAVDPEQRQRIDAVLALHGQAEPAPGAAMPAGVADAQVQFDNIHTRQAGERSFVDLHMHVPGEWSVARGARLRKQVEAALLEAVPGLYARIELLPLGMSTAIELAEQRANGGPDSTDNQTQTPA